MSLTLAVDFLGNHIKEELHMQCCLRQLEVEITSVLFQNSWGFWGTSISFHFLVPKHI